MTCHQYIIQSIPDTAYYIPNFITEEEEKRILHKVYAAPKPKWTQLNNRRLQNWGGLPHENGMIPEPIPEWLQSYIDKVVNFYDKKSIPNHVLVNEYLSGQGIMPHLDGSLFYPTVCTISCGSSILLDFYPYMETANTAENVGRSKDFTLLLERRSLLVLQDDLYNKFLHGIKEIEYDVIDDTIKNLYMCNPYNEHGTVLDRNTRVSLTIRHVPKCSKFKIKILG